MARAAAASSGERPYFLEHPDCDRLLAMLMAAAGQLTTVYERLDTLVRVLERKGLIEKGELDLFEPDAEAQAERLGWDEAFVRRLLRVLAYELEAKKAAAEAKQG
ncbi:MAG: hypothetical protein R3C16_01710 [Hyphomonadaceae bacterium]